ncbi:MAG: hypothetical protein ABJD07_09720 [Gemmatimonadaceae bacterium]
MPDDPHPPATHGRMLGRDLGILLVSATLGGVVAALAAPVLQRYFAPGAARDVAVALGAAVSSATHARLAHGHPWRAVAVSLAISIPLVYGVMRTVHLVVG